MGKDAKKRVTYQTYDRYAWVLQGVNDLTKQRKRARELIEALLTAVSLTGLEDDTVWHILNKLKSTLDEEPIRGVDDD